MLFLQNFDHFVGDIHTRIHRKEQAFVFGDDDTQPALGRDFLSDWFQLCTELGNLNLLILFVIRTGLILNLRQLAQRGSFQQ